MRKRDRKHLQYVGRQDCSVPGCLTSAVPHHVRTAQNSGTSIKPSDRCTAPLCWAHHTELHDHGQRTFERRYGVDLTAEAAFWDAVSGQEMPG